MGYERSEVALDGGVKRPMTIRITHIYRREDSEWKLVHRHGYFARVDQNRPPRKEKGGK